MSRDSLDFPRIAVSFSLAIAVELSDVGTNFVTHINVESSCLPVPARRKGIYAVATQSYEIQDGVRPAKAAEMIGKKTINAEIVDHSGKTLAVQEVPIDSLHSPHKSTIDVSSPQKMGRFTDTLTRTKAGSKPPNIVVSPGSKGPTIQDVTLDLHGTN